MTATAIADTVKTARQKAGISGRELERAAGVSSGTVSRIEGGKYAAPAAETLGKIAEALGTSVDRLLGNPDADQVEGAGAGLRTVPLGRLVAWAGNPRKHMDKGGLDELAASIAAEGLVEPLIVRPTSPGEDFEVVAGGRRFAAMSKLAGAGDMSPSDEVPVVVRDLTDAEALVVAIVENLQREDAPPVDEARGFKALMAPSKGPDGAEVAGMDKAEIARRIGKSVRHVELRLALVDKLGKPALKALEDGAITLAQARVMTSAPKGLQERAVEAVKERPAMRADDVRRVLTQGLPAFEAAFFDARCYSGELVYDEADGETPVAFADEKQFEKLQAGAIAAEVADLETRHKAVHVVARYGTSPIDRWQYDAKDKPDPQNGVALIRFSHDGSVRIIENLVKKPAAKSEAKNKAGTPVYTKALVTFTKNAKTAILQDAIAADDTAGLKLAIMGLIPQGGWNRDGTIKIRPEKAERNDLAQGETALEIAKVYASRLSDAVTATEVPGLGPYVASDPVALWRLLGERLDAGELVRFLGALTALRCGSWSHCREQPGDEPLAVAVATDLEAEPHADNGGTWAIEADFLELCRKPKLIEILLDERMTVASTTPDEAGKMTMKQLRTAILEDPSHGAILPAIMTWGTESELAG